MHCKTKGNQILFSIRTQSGQLTLFFAVALLSVVTLVAFMVNIGLFVKAKINLQNAVDAAAWSGAATQARQLTDIAYLNWEMRNVYKEWMFKYYVLGNRSGRGVKNPGTVVNPNNGPAVTAGKSMDFTVYSPLANSPNKVDKYNIPSVCLFLGTSPNAPDLCSIYSTSGIPITNSPAIGAANEIFSRMNDSISAQVAEDCNARTQANFLATLNWALGVGDVDQTSPLSNEAPQLALNRPGAWPSAMEIAFRIRNLEGMVNLAPITSGVCKNGGVAGCTVAVSALEQQGLAANERPVKAFYSAYRNLGNEFDREMKDTFVLTEIPPNEVVFGKSENLSNLLIPEKAEFRIKRYLDLKLILLNLTTFYTMLSTISERPSTPGRLATDAKCYHTKVGIPVPGYPLGFEKNSSVLTYYAVKGTAQFIGLFNPFNTPITLEAFAAAKPFGGRIGPKLFNTSDEESAVLPRWLGDKRRSSAYLFGINTKDIPQPTASGGGQNKPNRPVIPDVEDFWLSSEDDVIGGFTSDKLVRYSVPNLPYDPEDLSNVNTTEKIFIQRFPSAPGTELTKGLYNVEDYKKFQNNISFTPGGITQESEVLDAINLVRAPTNYEAKNYLIPSPSKVNNDLRNDSFGYPAGRLRIYAPLYGPALTYESADEVLKQIRDFLLGQEKSIDAYTLAMANIAKDYRNMEVESSTGSALGIYGNAADKIHDENPDTGAKLSCASMAGQFRNFFLGSTDSGVIHGPTPETKCPAAMWDSLRSIYTGTIAGGSNSASSINVDFYQSFITLKEKPEELDKIKNYFSAYIPGPLTGGSADTSGQITNPFRPSAATSISLRNFYSTKLVGISSLVEGQSGYWDKIQPIYSEGALDDVERLNFQGDQINSLNLSSVTSLNASQIFQ
jgi:Flp pilus assembly protein TadG